MYNYSQGDSDPQYQEAYKQAERRVRAKLGFYWHLASYVIVNGLLIIVYLITGPVPGFYSYPWFVWPMFGWGIGLLFHYLGVFVFSNVNSEATRRQMIEAEMQRMRGNSSNLYPPAGYGANSGLGSNAGSGPNTGSTSFPPYYGGMPPANNIGTVQSPFEKPPENK
ncbi:MAG TPA: 2TM domain-containing protein [Chloroflexia bacterium]|nr:2TM domain-containing protein [Chloroflexia bacterium]